MKKITIFTSTYNRGYVLNRAYESLVAQKNKNFIWMIIDDGSTDNTEGKVKEWIDEDKIEIIYYRLTNGGKATAYNYAIKHVKTEYFLFSLDSDDELVENGIDILYECIVNNDSKGFVFLNNVTNTNNKKKNRYDLTVLNGKSYFEALNNHLINVETVTLFKTSYLKKFVFPVIEKEKFFTEAYIFYQMREPFIWTNEIIENSKYLNDGLTKNTMNLFVNFPTSWYLYNKMRQKYANSIYYIIKYTIYLIVFGLLSKQKKILEDSKYKVLTVLLYPIGILGKYYLLLKGRVK